jgi:hypothetical protein
VHVVVVVVVVVVVNSNINEFQLKLKLLKCSLEAFMAMFQVDVFWVVTPYSVVVGYQRFRGPWR